MKSLCESSMVRKKYPEQSVYTPDAITIQTFAHGFNVALHCVFNMVKSHRWSEDDYA